MRSTLQRALRRYLRTARKEWVATPRWPRFPGARLLALRSRVAETRISEVLNGKRRRFSVADAGRLAVETQIPLEILLGLDLVPITCSACGWSGLRRPGARELGHARWRHGKVCPALGES